MPKTLIYDPRHDSLRPQNSLMLPIEAVSSPIRFPRILSRGGGRKSGTLDAVEIKGDWIHPGTNLNVPDEDFEHISKHPVGSELIARGALVLVEPSIEEGQIPTETTRDYSEKNALELIRNSNDLEWLEQSERKEERPVITKALTKRITEIKAMVGRG